MLERMPPAEDHFQRLARLLDLENRVEAQRAVERRRKLKPSEAEKSGTALVDLMIVDEDAGLGGRYLVRFAKRSRGELPWTRLDVGSPVLLSGMQPGPGPWRGVVSQNSLRPSSWHSIICPTRSIRSSCGASTWQTTKSLSCGKRRHSIVPARRVVTVWPSCGRSC